MPSVLSIVEIVMDLKLIAAFQWIVSGYNQLLGVLARLVEPLIQPLIAWLNAVLGLKLELRPHWRPLFVLAVIPAVALLRTHGGFVRPLVMLRGVIFVLLPILLACLMARLVPETREGWRKGAYIAAFFVSLVQPILIWELSINVKTRGLSIRRALGIWGLVSAGLGGISLLLAWSGNGHPLELVAGIVMSIGGIFLAHGLKSGSQQTASLGLTILGGFVAAGLILAADAMVKMLS